MQETAILEGLVGVLFIVVALLLLVFRQQVHRFWGGFFPSPAPGGFSYVWQYIVGPLFLLVLGMLLVAGGIVQR